MRLGGGSGAVRLSDHGHSALMVTSRARKAIDASRAGDVLAIAKIEVLLLVPDQH
jgi:hypothetical protein